MLSFSEIGPVRKMPAGTTSRPPPCLFRVLMALAKALVFIVTPSATAPKSVSLTVFCGMVGANGSLMLTGSP